MGVLKGAFNALTRIHSRAATLKRLGSPNIVTPVRITPSNYFRFLEGPSATVVHGREFLIPLDSMLGTATQTMAFTPTAPTEGQFSLVYDGSDTTALDFDATAPDIQDALQAISGLENVTVTAVGGTFEIVFWDIPNPLLLSYVDLEDPMGLPPVPALDATITFTQTREPWETPIKRGDRIVDTFLGQLTIDEIIEVPDVGGSVMGYRIRTE